MHADIESAVRIARLAAGFDWAWTLDNLEQFCSLAGWQQPVPDEYGAEIRTDLNVSSPLALAVNDARFCRDWLPGGQMVYVTVYLTDDPIVDSPEIQKVLVDWFAELAGRLCSALGAPVRLFGSQPKIFWDLPKVALVLSVDFDRLEISLRVANTTYQHQANLMFEDDDDEEDVSPSVTARPSTPEWAEFSASLALTLARLPEGGNLELSINGELGAQFTMRRLDGLRLGSARRGWIDDNPQASMMSRKGIQWPATYSVLIELADSLTAELREDHRVSTPSEILTEAWVDSYRCVPDLTPIGETRMVER